MFKLDLPPDPKEAAAREARRRREEERKKRLFNPEIRKQVVDKDVLEQQIQEKKAREAQEKEYQRRADEQMARQAEIAMRIQQEQEQQKRQELLDDIQFNQTQHLATMTQRQREQLKFAKPLGHDEEALGPSSLQKFDGEDNEYETRMRQQRDQQREWAAQQTQERMRKEQEEQELEQLHQEQQLLQAKIAERMAQRQQQEAREIQQHLAQTNLEQLEQKRRLQEEEKAKEFEQIKHDIESAYNSDLLSENPEVAKSHGKKKILPDRYKGMSPDEIASIREEQRQQAEFAQSKRLQAQEQSKLEEEAQMRMARRALLEERKMQRQMQEERRRMVEDNMVLADSQKTQKATMNSSLGKNSIEGSFFDQFQKDAR